MRFEVIETVTSEGHDVQAACRLLDVSRAGYYHWTDRPLSPRAIRHALTDLIVETHTTSRGTYGAPRVHAELRLGRDVIVGHRQVANRMRWVERASAIFEYLEIFHNRQRRHGSIGMLTPIEYENRHRQPA